MASIQPARIMLREFSQTLIEVEREFSQFKWMIEYKAVKGELTSETYSYLSSKYLPYLSRFRECHQNIKQMNPYMSEFQHTIYKNILREYKRTYGSILREVRIIIENYESPKKMKQLLYAIF